MGLRPRSARSATLGAPLPTRRCLLLPQAVDRYHVMKTLHQRQHNAKSNYGKRSRDLPPLEVGGKVRFRPNGEREWRKAEVMPRSYMLDEYGHRLRAVPLQSVKSKLGKTGESELAERETGETREATERGSFPAFSPASPRLSLASLDFLARAFLARVTILRDCSQSNSPMTPRTRAPPISTQPRVRVTRLRIQDRLVFEKPAPSPVKLERQTLPLQTDLGVKLGGRKDSLNRVRGEML